MTTYTKLKTGAWGVRVQGTAKAGDKLTVTKKDGTKKTETVAAVLWTGEGVSLCSIVPTAPSAVAGAVRSAFSRPSSHKCRPGMDCPRCGSEPLNARLHCWECGFTGTR